MAWHMFLPIRLFSPTHTESIVDFLMVLRVLRVRDSRRGRGERGEKGEGGEEIGREKHCILKILGLTR